MAGEAVREARRALARLRRAVEKAARELETAEGALRAAGGDPLPADVFEAAAEHLRAVGEFIDEQAERLEARMLEAGGIDAGRLRRGGDP
ncbi:MAG TPA: hypothetical protein VF158_07695 [Longimicrobiales bacterium]